MVQSAGVGIKDLGVNRRAVLPLLKQLRTRLRLPDLGRLIDGVLDIRRIRHLEGRPEIDIVKPLDQRVRNPDFLIKHLRRVIRVREDIRAVEVDLDFVYLVQRSGGRLRVPAEQHRIGHNTDHKRDPRRRECEKPH